MSREDIPLITYQKGLRPISLSFLMVATLLMSSAISANCQVVKHQKGKKEQTLHLRKSPVSYHMSFDNKDFFDEDIIEQSGKKSLEERKIDFPAGKFGRGIRMSFIPEPPDADNMSGIDLDLVTAVMFNTHPGNKMGFNEPFIWGSGRISPRLGAVAFWAKGDPPFDGPLFEQTSNAFGRKERDLLGVEINKDHNLSAYLRDARYIRHAVVSNVQWDASRWNFVVLSWDWANGMKLWLNGKEIATSWGEEGWFQTASPGLFHLPAPGVTYDELYLMDRPLSGPEINRLMSSNTPPGNESPVYTRKNYDTKWLARLSGADHSGSLPIVSPDKSLSLSEVWPTEISDGHVPGWYMTDGRNEMAWPHPYAFFTIIPGDGDFHAGKADIKTSPTDKVNYITLTGNLTDVKVLEGSQQMENPTELFSVPSDNQFFYGATIPTTKGATFRIPFTEKYGTPAGFKGGVKLPLSGKKRIQNVGLYHFTTISSDTYKPKGKTLTLSTSDSALQLDRRTQFAINAVTARDERTIAVASYTFSQGSEETVDIGAFHRLNIMSKPYTDKTGVSEVTLSLPIKTSKTEETLFVRVRDPAVPSRLWNQFAVNLKGFNNGYKRLVLTIDFQDIVLTGGDRLWLDVGTAGKTDIKMGNTKNKAQLFVSTVAPYRAVDAYAAKELISAKAQYSKQYEFKPWKFTGKKVSLDHPYAYGGPFDMILPALAVERVDTTNFAGKYFIRVNGPKWKPRGDQKIPEKTILLTEPNPVGAPKWALYMKAYNKKRDAMVDWWAQRQNDDGQFGGGWNDDTLFLRGFVDLGMNGNDTLRQMIDKVFAGFELTDIYKNGYCNIYPIDRLHTGDFIRERYSTVMMNLGQAYAAERSMESAWHLGKPKQTPRYYANAYKSSANVLKWYWNKDSPDSAYVSRPLEEITKRLRLYNSVFNNYYFYRMTQSDVMRDDFVPFGSASWGKVGSMSADDIYTYMLGGSGRSRSDTHPAHAVTWPSGGGADVSRIVLRADDTSLKAAVYSFDKKTRQLKMRLDRIQSGQYEIGLYADPKGSGKAGDPMWTSRQHLSRFDEVTLPVPPHTPVVVKVKQIKSIPRPNTLPDLAIDRWDAILEGGEITATIHNIGNKNAKNITVRLLDGEQTLQEKVINGLDAPTDFVPKRMKISFTNVPSSRNLRVVIDPEHNIEEILEENNGRKVVKAGESHRDQVLWDIHRNNLGQARSLLTK